MRGEPGLQIEAVIDAAIDSGDLTISDSVTWTRLDGGSKARVNVQHPEEADFFLELTQSNRLVNRFTIQLVFRRKAARRYCSNHTHTQKQDCPQDAGVQFFGYHKHRWSDETGDECIYVPEDMNGGPIEDSFYEFLAECGITFLGEWRDPPPIQFRFETVR
jgi:hypothetical protein